MATKQFSWFFSYMACCCS